MKREIQNVNMLIDCQNAQVNLSSEEFVNNLEVNEMLQEFFEKKLPGRMYFDKNNDLIFKRYHTGQNATTVWQKEQVGQCVVTRSAKAMKISLSLPITMSQHQMIMTVLDECTRLTEALRNGLYERMVSGQQPTTVALEMQTESVEQAA